MYVCMYVHRLVSAVPHLSCRHRLLFCPHLECINAYDRVHDLNGKDYRLLQNNLDKDIVAGESKILVKKDKVIVKLQKVNDPTTSWHAQFSLTFVSADCVAPTLLSLTPIPPSDRQTFPVPQVKGEYGSYDNWSNLAAKKQKKVDTKANPQAGTSTYKHRPAQTF